METKKEIKQLEKDLKNLEVKELSTKAKILMFLGLIVFVLFSLWWEIWR